MAGKKETLSQFFSLPVLKRFLVVFLPLLLLVSFVVTAIYYSGVRTSKHIYEVSEVENVNLQKEIISNNFKAIVSDVVILSGHHEMRKFLESNEVRHREALAEEFLVFCRNKRVYDQIRFLDARGDEVVRVNYNGGSPEIVPEDRLQSKAHRYYFNATFELDAGRIYVSPFDLNVEEREIEQPPKPIIRFGTPVVDGEGRKRGVVILNYLGENLIRNLREASSSALGQSMLLNADGYWLRGPNPADEFGFMYEDKVDRTFRSVYPEAWKRISKTDKGQFVGTEGMFTYSTVHPFLECMTNGKNRRGEFKSLVRPIKAETYRWKIVSHVSPAVLNSPQSMFLGRLLILFGVSVVLLAISSGLLAHFSVRRQQTERALYRRDAVLDAVSYAAQQFMKTASWEEPIRIVLHRLGSAAEVSRVYVFENRFVGDGEILTSQRYEWAAPGITSQIDNPELRDIPLLASGFERWVDTLGGGGVIHGHVREFPENEQEVLAVQDIRSIVIVPIVVERQWWGFIGFDECLTERRWSALEIDALKAAAGTLSAAIQRELAEEALRESEERYRDLFENANDLIQSVTPDGRFIYVNRAWRVALGYREEEVPYLTFPDIIHPDSREYCMDMFQKVLSGRVMDHVEATFVAKNGRTIIVEGNINCRYRNGKPVATRGIFRDVTERRKIDRMKDEFVATVSHELRTPLTSIHGAISLMSREMVGKLPEDVKALIDIANRNSQRLVNLINDILDIQKIESGRVEFDCKPFKLHKLIQQSLEDNKAFAEQFDVRFVFEEVLPGVWVHADGDRVLQVMTNLLSNAAKFSPPHSSVKVSMSMGEGFVRVAVKDRGPGIPEEFRGSIFQKFTQVDSSITRERGGAGLGLSIAKMIVEKHNGRIGFETETNVGTTFYFELPEWRES